MSFTGLLVMGFELIVGEIMSFVNTLLMDILEFVLDALTKATSTIYENPFILNCFTFAMRLSLMFLVVKILIEILLSVTEIVQGISPFEILKNSILAVVGIFLIQPITLFCYTTGTYILDAVISLTTVNDKLFEWSLKSGILEIIIFITLVILLFVILFQSLKRTADLVAYTIFGYFEAHNLGKNYEGFAMWVRGVTALSVTQAFQMGFLKLGLGFLADWSYINVSQGTNNILDGDYSYLFLGFALLIGACSTPNYIKEKLHQTNSARALSMASKQATSIGRSAISMIKG